MAKLNFKSKPAKSMAKSPAEEVPVKKKKLRLKGVSKADTALTDVPDIREDSTSKADATAVDTGNEGTIASFNKNSKGALIKRLYDSYQEEFATDSTGDIPYMLPRIAFKDYLQEAADSGVLQYEYIDPDSEEVVNRKLDTADLDSKFYDFVGDVLTIPGRGLAAVADESFSLGDVSGVRSMANINADDPLFIEEEGITGVDINGLPIKATKYTKDDSDRNFLSRIGQSVARDPATLPMLAAGKVLPKINVKAGLNPTNKFLKHVPLAAEESLIYSGINKAARTEGDDYQPTNIMTDILLGAVAGAGGSLLLDGIGTLADKASRRKFKSFPTQTALNKVKKAGSNAEADLDNLLDETYDIANDGKYGYDIGETLTGVKDDIARLGKQKGESLDVLADDLIQGGVSADNAAYADLPGKVFYDDTRNNLDFYTKKLKKDAVIKRINNDISSDYLKEYTDAVDDIVRNNLVTETKHYDNAIRKKILEASDKSNMLDLNRDQSFNLNDPSRIGKDYSSFLEMADASNPDNYAYKARNLNKAKSTIDKDLTNYYKKQGGVPVPGSGKDDAAYDMRRLLNDEVEDQVDRALNSVVTTKGHPKYGELINETDAGKEFMANYQATNKLPTLHDMETILYGIGSGSLDKSSTGTFKGGKSLGIDNLFGLLADDYGQKRRLISNVADKPTSGFLSRVAPIYGTAGLINDDMDENDLAGIEKQFPTSDAKEAADEKRKNKEK